MYDLISIMCCHKNCGIIFCMPHEWVDMRRGDNALFYCPSGHQQNFKESSKMDNLKKIIAQKDRLIHFERNQKESAQRSLATTKGVVTKLKNKAAQTLIVMKETPARKG